jgi:hypothetical protein
MAAVTLRNAAQLPHYLMHLNELQEQVDSINNRIKEARGRQIALLQTASHTGKRKQEQRNEIVDSIEKLETEKLEVEKTLKKQENSALDFVESLDKVAVMNVFEVLSSDDMPLPRGRIAQCLQDTAVNKLCRDFKGAEGSSYGAETYDPKERVRRKHYQFKLECSHRWFPRARELPISIRGILIWCGSREAPTEQLKLWKVLSCPGIQLNPQIRKYVADFLANQSGQSNNQLKRPKTLSKKNELSIVLRTLESFGLLARDSQLKLTLEELNALKGLIFTINTNKAGDAHGPAITICDLKLIMQAMENISVIQDSSYWFDSLADIIAYVIGHPDFFSYVNLQKLIPSNKNGLMIKVKEQLWNTLMQYGDPTNAQRNDKKVIHLLGVLAESTSEFTNKKRGILVKLQLDPQLAVAAHTILTRSQGSKLFAQTALLMLAEKKLFSGPLSKESIELILSVSRCYPEDQSIYFPQLNAILALYVQLNNHLQIPLPDDFSKGVNASFDEDKSDDTNSVYAILNRHINYVFSRSDAPQPDEALGVMGSLVTLSKDHRFELSRQASSNFYSKLLDIDTHLLDKDEIQILLQTLQKLLLVYPLRCANMFKDKIILEFISHLITHHHDPKNVEERVLIQNILTSCVEGLDKDLNAQAERTPDMESGVEGFEVDVNRIVKSLR